MWTPKNESALSENNILVFLLLEVICVVLMVLDHSAKIATPIRSTISILTYPLIKIVELPQNAYEFINSSISNQFQLLDENVQLKQQLSQAQIELLQLDVISQQNIELRQLLNAKQQLPLKTTAAFVININSGDNNHHLVINQGYNQGVGVGQTVLDLHGVAGQVAKVDLESSHVIMITDNNHATPVEILRTGVRTIAYGTGDLVSLSLPEIPPSADIKLGDILITSGYGDVFPRGLNVATINDIVDSKDTSFQQALATPSANLNLIKQVLLVWSKVQAKDNNKDNKEL
ncbi:MAG: rod shape-determining protein MreC [Proteobacteria bacterium]|nr:rod shape-determining protein MreC [Pseudomonadota bacterium]